MPVTGLRAWSARLLRWEEAATAPSLWCLGTGLLVAWSGASPLPALAGAAAVPLVRRRLRARERRRSAERLSAQVVALCEEVAAEVRAGAQPPKALLTAGVTRLGEAGEAVAAAARWGGDVPQSLRRAAVAPGAAGLLSVAACWKVATDNGAGLASGLDRVAAGLRAERERRAELAAHSSGPRATAWTLAVLPVGGVAMGGALGADPVRVLLHTPAGWACLVVGGLLEWVGVAWSGRILRSAEVAS
ncbi:type II secretion system F family protein [Streptomyces sp. NPDC059740]|uniref:type II secretion system F family protein n=1 Tax=Streptomyces sp. NPDC059740 TaxID=3346926 RepID=UPI003649235D